MIWLFDNRTKQVCRARCRMCTHHLKNRYSYMLPCSLKTDEYGAHIIDKWVSFNQYACDKFCPRPNWSLYDSQIQLELPFKS